MLGATVASGTALAQAANSSAAPAAAGSSSAAMSAAGSTSAATSAAGTTSTAQPAAASSSAAQPAAGNGNGGQQGQNGQGQNGNGGGNGAVYVRTDLVSDLQNLAQPADPNLQNAWGVASAPGGALWVSDNNDGLSTLYDGNGVKNPLTITIPLPPGKAPPPAAAPTGMVWNPTTAFTVTAGSASAPATFIFDTEDGTIVAWNATVDPIASGASTATIVADNSASGAVYKGLAFGTNSQGNFLFATNFSAGTVDVFDSTFKPATLDGNFSDPNIPAGFAPFGIANIDNNLFVTYAQQNATKDDEITGPGLGFVDVFSTNGVLIKRFASGGNLNAPWGVARATQNFGQFSNDILIGNFGQGQFGGQINAFDGSNGNFHGALQDANGQPISIDGLWAVVFGTFSHSDADTLYYTAGPNQQQDGLFGKIAAQPASNSAMNGQGSNNSANGQGSNNSANGQGANSTANAQGANSTANAQGSNSTTNAQ